MRFFNPSKPLPKKPAGPGPIVCDVGSGGIDFLALLREAVAGVNRHYQEAVDDLWHVCSELDAALSGLSEGRLRIKLIEVSDRPEEVAYELQLHERATCIYSFNMYKVPVAGYPIHYGTRGGGAAFSGFESQLPNKTAMEQHFAHLLTDEKSPLVVQVSFAMRMASKAPWPMAA